MLNKDVAKNSSVNFDRGDVGKPKRLAIGKKMVHFSKKVIANSNERLPTNSDFRSKGILSFFPRGRTPSLNRCQDRFGASSEPGASPFLFQSITGPASQKLTYGIQKL